MLDTDITTTYKESKEYADNIMNDIESALSNHNIKFNRKTTYEIEIKGDNIKEIKDIIKTVDVPKDILKMLISTVKVDDFILISQRMKN